MRINSYCCDTNDGQHNCQQDKQATQDVFLFNDEKQAKGDENQAVYKKQDNQLRLFISFNNTDENTYI
jgi:hypothetical protein